MTRVDMSPGDTFEIQGASPKDFRVCAWRDVCRCSELVAGATSTSHLAIRPEPYEIGPNASDDYTIYAIPAAAVFRSGPIANGTNGDIHVGTGTKGVPGL